MINTLLNPNAQLDPILVDEREARRLLGGLCAKTMFNLRRSGSLVGVKIGSRTMYDVADLRAFVERLRSAACQVADPQTTLAAPDKRLIAGGY